MMIAMCHTSCNLFEGSVEGSFVLCMNDLCKICTLWVAIFLTRPSKATGLLECPIGVVPIAVRHGVHGVHAPMLFAEAAVLVGPMDQPLAGLLHNLGVDRLHLPF